MSTPRDGAAPAVLNPTPSVQVQDAHGTQVRHGDGDILVTTSIVRDDNAGRLGEIVYSEVRQTQRGYGESGLITITASGRYLIRVQAGSLSLDESAPFTISHGDLASLQMTRQPAGAVGGQVLGLQPIVTLKDSSGNSLTSMHAVFLSCQVIEEDRIVSARVLVSEIQATGSSFGVIAFNTIAIAPVGTYSLKFTTVPDVVRRIDNTSVESCLFDVMPGAPHRLSLTSMLGGCFANKICDKQVHKQAGQTFYIKYLLFAAY